jgi:hypothetical protein
LFLVEVGCFHRYKNVYTFRIPPVFTLPRLEAIPAVSPVRIQIVAHPLPPIHHLDTSDTGKLLDTSGNTDTRDTKIPA